MTRTGIHFNSRRILTACSGELHLKKQCQPDRPNGACNIACYCSGHAANSCQLVQYWFARPLLGTLSSFLRRLLWAPLSKSCQGQTYTALEENAIKPPMRDIPASNTLQVPSQVLRTAHHDCSVPPTTSPSDRCRRYTVAQRWYLLQCSGIGRGYPFVT